MSEPKYDEDIVNLGYLKKVISDTEENIGDIYKNVSRHYASKPQPPYNKGDTWIDGDIVYVCINSRQIGLYTDSDWVTESGAKEEIKNKNKTYLKQPSNYSPGDMWILQSDNDHKAGKKGEILISTAGRAEYDEGDWINMLGYGTIRSINEVADNLNKAINRIGDVEEAIEDGIIITFYQDSEPEAKHIGDLWYVTGDIEGYTKGKIYRYDGTSWVILDDPAIQKAFDEANEARIVADGKIQSFYSATEPTEGVGVGDLWIDIDNNNQLYRYNGTKWVAVYDTRINELVVNVGTVTERVATIETDLGEIDLKVKETTTTITTIEGQVDNITNTTSEAEGKLIHIKDSAEEPLVDISLHGESIQEGTPTPENPIEIENVEGNVEVTVTGKNLAQINKGDVNSYRLIHSIPVKKGEKITVIFKGTETNNSRLGCYLYADEILASSTAVYLQSIPVDNTEALTTITIPNSGYFSIACSYGYQAVTVEKLFVGKGEYTLDDYEEYKSQTAYFPLAEGQKLMEESCLADDGVHNTRKQVVFDGSEIPTIFTYGTAHVNTTIFKFSALISKMNGALKYSSHFKVRDNTVATLNTDDNWVMNDGSGSVFICIENIKASTIEEVKAYLTEQYANGAPIILEYKLAEEEIVPYTEEQQKAWNKIKALTTYKNITNITSEAYAKVVYMRDNGLDVYETKQNADKRYTETTEKFAETKITTDGIKDTVSQTQTMVGNNYNELKTKFDDYAPKSDVVSLQTSVEKIQTDTYTKTEINTKLIDGSVEKVSTTAGTFDENGLTIEKTNAKTKGNFNEKGITVMDATSGNSQELLFAGYDEEINETIVRSKNMTVEKYFVIGNTARQENYINPVLGGKSVGVFIL